MSERPNVYPCLFYSNAPVAIDWLCRAFGFTQAMVVPGDTGSIIHAELRAGCGTIMLSSASNARGYMSPRDLAGVNQLVCVYVDDPDAHHAQAVAAGAEISKAPSDTSYGSRDYVARDLEGHLWVFG